MFNIIVMFVFVLFCGFLASYTYLLFFIFFCISLVFGCLGRFVCCVVLFVYMFSFVFCCFELNFFGLLCFDLFFFLRVFIWY